MRRGAISAQSARTRCFKEASSAASSWFEKREDLVPAHTFSENVLRQ